VRVPEQALESLHRCRQPRTLWRSVGLPIGMQLVARLTKVMVTAKAAAGRLKTRGQPFAAPTKANVAYATHGPVTKGKTMLTQYLQSRFHCNGLRRWQRPVRWSALRLQRVAAVFSSRGRAQCAPAQLIIKVLPWDTEAKVNAGGIHVLWPRLPRRDGQCGVSFTVVTVCFRLPMTLARLHAQPLTPIRYRTTSFVLDNAWRAS
jgi:hypothetical protein